MSRPLTAACCDESPQPAMARNTQTIPIATMIFMSEILGLDRHERMQTNLRSNPLSLWERADAGTPARGEGSIGTDMRVPLTRRASALVRPLPEGEGNEHRLIISTRLDNAFLRLRKAERSAI